MHVSMRVCRDRSQSWHIMCRCSDAEQCHWQRACWQGQCGSRIAPREGARANASRFRGHLRLAKLSLDLCQLSWILRGRRGSVNWASDGTNAKKIEQRNCPEGLEIRMSVPSMYFIRVRCHSQGIDRSAVMALRPGRIRERGDNAQGHIQ